MRKCIELGCFCLAKVKEGGGSCCSLQHPEGGDRESGVGSRHGKLE